MSERLRMKRSYQPMRYSHLAQRGIKASLFLANQPIHTLRMQASRLLPEHAVPCLYSPRRCPFGGACHTGPLGIQAKLTVSRPGDPYEQEADRVADQVLRMPEPQVQRACADCAEEETVQTKRLAPTITPLVQRQETEAKTTSLEPKPPVAVPGWNQLPVRTKADLERCGLNETWFNDHADDLRLTVLNLYVKLKGLGFWHFIGWNESSTSRGCFEFLTPRLASFRKALQERKDFTSPQKSFRKYWNSRELRSSCSLEFKHFEKWPPEKVQAHIDRIGLLPKSKLWWLVPVVPLGHMAAHGLTPDSFKDVFGIRSSLLQQGWDRETLLGTGASSIQRKARQGNYTGNPSLQNQIASLRGRGNLLPEPMRAFFEPRFGRDFGGVRVHTDTRAAETARALNARAFTLGHDVVFGAGEYAPGTGEGRRLLAHELTHVVQQLALSSTHGSPSLPLQRAMNDETAPEWMASKITKGGKFKKYDCNFPFRIITTAIPCGCDDLGFAQYKSGHFTLIGEGDRRIVFPACKAGGWCEDPPVIGEFGKKKFFGEGGKKSVKLFSKIVPVKCFSAKKGKSATSATYQFDDAPGFSKNIGAKYTFGEKKRKITGIVWEVKMKHKLWCRDQEIISITFDLTGKRTRKQDTRKISVSK